MPLRPPEQTSLYRVTNSVNDKVYIGVTKHPERRFKRHCRLNSKKPTLLNLAVAKYGAENFSMEILCVSTEEYCYELEAKAIAAYCTQTPNGYNVTSGGFGVKGRFGEMHHLYGKKRDPQIVEKIRAANKGQKATPEQIEKMRRSLTGRKLSAETKEKISKVKKGFKLTPEQLAKISLANTGKKHSPETIEKMKLAQKGKVFTEEAKRNISAGLAKKWEDPDFRERMMAARKAARAKRLESTCP